MTDFAMRLTDRAQMRWLWIGALTCASVLFVLLFAPKVDYLPVAQTDMIWNNLRCRRAATSRRRGPSSRRS
jgi:hypothetical protein